MKITVYSTSACPICKLLREFLKEKNLAFKDKIVDKDEAAMKEMAELSGGRIGVPFVVIEKDGKTEKLLGFDKSRLTQALGI